MTTTEPETITRSFPHPDGRFLDITMPVAYWRSLQWLNEDCGVTAGYIIHCMDRRNSQQDPSEAFMEFIGAAIHDAHREAAEQGAARR